MITKVETAIEPVAGDWDALVDRVGAPPFLRPGWIDAWWRAFGRGRLEIATVRREETLVAILPLSRRRGVLASPTNLHTPVFGPVVDGPDAGAELARLLLSRPCRRLSISFLDEADPWLGEYRSAAQSAGRRVIERVQLRSPFLAIEGDWASYWKRLSKNLRGDLRRRRRRLEERGAVRLELDNGDERLGELIDEAFALEASGWKGAAGSAVSSRPETRRFYGELCRWAANRGLLRVFFLRLESRALAMMVCLEDRDICFPLKMGHDPDYGEYSPGGLLLEAVIRRAFERGLSRVEIGGGEEPYKLRWTSTLRGRRQLEAFRGSPLGLLEWTARAYGRPAAARLMSRRRD